MSRTTPRRHTPALDAIAQQLAESRRTRPPKPAHETECAALRQRVAELEAELCRRDVVALVDQAVKAGHLLPSLRDWSIGLGTKDTEALKGFIESCARAIADRIAADQHQKGN